MISLIQAVKLMDLKDGNVVALCHEHFDHEAQLISIRDIKETYDMRRTKVRRIHPYHFMYDPGDDTIEFVITGEFKTPKRYK